MAKLSGGEDYPIYFGAKPELFRIAAELRHSITPAEKQLWNHLRNKKQMGFKFRRQHPFNEIILDFYCHDAKLSIEVDGDVHETPSQKERDQERTRILKNFGITELRFTNWEIKHHPYKVLSKINEYLKKIHHPSPGRGKGRG